MYLNKKDLILKGCSKYLNLFNLGESCTTKEQEQWVPQLDGVTQRWVFSEELTPVNGYSLEFECVGSHEGGVLISTASFGLQFRLLNGVYVFFGCDAEINGIPATSGVTTYDGADITSFKLTVTTARPLGTLLSKATSFLSASAMRNFKMKDTGGIVLHQIPLTNKAKGATQLATVGNVNATMVNYTEAVWETMNNLYQLYAFVTAAGWAESLSERWPDAPLVGGYRVLVFTNVDYPLLKEQYPSAEFKELTAEQTINAITTKELGPFVCSLEQTKQIMNHFSPPVEEI